MVYLARSMDPTSKNCTLDAGRTAPLASRASTRLSCLHVLVDGETQEVHLTYRQLDEQARAIATWLQSHATPGERALLLYPPGLEFITTFSNCLMCIRWPGSRKWVLRRPKVEICNPGRTQVAQATHRLGARPRRGPCLARTTRSAGAARF